MDLFDSEPQLKKINKLEIKPFKTNEALLFTYFKIMHLIDFSNNDNKILIFSEIPEVLDEDLHELSSISSI